MNHKKRKKEKERKAKEKESCRERDSSLIFPMVGPTVLDGARGRVHPHDKGFT